ncbi:phenylacetate--CoA ligase family protein [Oceanirhabdus seepicola]|uniref:Phenylacetate--CoA ligase family protein n=1 Tax=Oceanirhabdus seepicola TaxID=2828781 RepID=A0A9J6P1G4_9CLOT|nr:hypothetical protein [Oceanirhabdus seepicola]MCM1990511.1 phenylacetate--CoA ligase family protein [Oceanirhabdus seepicola]
MYLYGIKNKLLKEGRKFKLISKTLEESQYYSKQELQNYQDKHLRKIISHSYNNVPYYKNLFDQIKLKPSDISTQEDLWKVPILTKKDVKENFKQLKAVNASKFLLNEGHTSGTTGTPAHFYRDLYSINFENAIVWRQWQWSKINIGDKMIVCRGNKVKIKEEKNIFWEQNFIQKQLFLSSYYLSDKNLKYYVQAIKKYGPRSLQAYPSTAYVIAKYLQKNNDKIKLNAVFTSSEPIYEFQRRIIEKYFQCKVWDFYGLAERVVSASECKYHNGLHINEEYSVTEIIDDKGQQAQEGFLVGTTLHNYAMPLIRYVTDDYTRINNRKCLCGREHRIIEPIETRKEDMIITKSGGFVSPRLISTVFKELKYISKSQVIQHDFDKFEIKIVPEQGFDNRETSRVIKGFEEIFQDKIDININLVEDIARTKNGKFKRIISNVVKGRV